MQDPDKEETNRKSGVAYAAALTLFVSVVSLCGAGWLLESVLAAKQAGLGCFKRLQHLWLHAGYQGKAWVAWAEARVAWAC